MRPCEHTQRRAYDHRDCERQRCSLRVDEPAPDASGSVAAGSAHCKQLPNVAEALQLVLPPVVEDEIGAGNEIPHGARCDDLAGTGSPEYASRKVDRSSPDVSARISISPVWTPQRMEIPTLSSASMNDSDAPVPRLSKRTTRAKVASCLKYSSAMGSSQSTSNEPYSPP